METLTWHTPALDLLWQGLVGATLVLTLILAALALGERSLRRAATARQMKGFFQLHLLLGVLALGLAFVLPACLGAERVMACLREVGTSLNFTRALGAAWLLTSGSLLVFDLLRTWKHSRQVLRLPLATDPKAHAELQQLQKRLCAGRSVDLCQGSKSGSPYVWGLHRHRVVLPPGLLASTGPLALRGLLAHELVHVRDHDAAWALLSLFLRRLFFFHPLASRMLDRHALWVEKCADQEAVREGGVPLKSLLQTLVEVASLCRQPTRLMPLRLSASRGFGELRERLEFLARGPGRRASWTRLGLTGLASLTVTLAATGAQAELLILGQRGGAPRTYYLLPQALLAHEKILASVLVGEEPLDRCRQILGAPDTGPPGF